MVGRRARISRTGALGRRGGIRLPRRLRQPGPDVGDPPCGRAGLLRHADETGAGRRWSWGGPNLPLSTDTATTETGTTPTACPLPDTGQRTGGRACTGQRPPPGTHRRAAVPVLLGRVHGRGASQVQGPQPSPSSSGRSPLIRSGSGRRSRSARDPRPQHTGGGRRYVSDGLPLHGHVCGLFCVSARSVHVCGPFLLPIFR